MAERLRIRATTTSGVTNDLSGVSQLSFSNAINGGYAVCSFVVPGNIAVLTTQMPAIDYLNDVTIYDESGTVVWQGYISDLNYTIGFNPDTTTVTCTGYQELLTKIPQQRSYITRDLSFFQPRSLANGNVRPDLVLSEVGNVADGNTNLQTNYGIRFQVSTGVSVPVNSGVGFLWMQPMLNNTIHYLSRIKFDITIVNNGNGTTTPTMTVGVYGGDNAAGFLGIGTFAANGTTSQSLDISSSASNRSQMMFFCSSTVAGAFPAQFAALLSNIRLLGIKTANGQQAAALTQDEPVYGHEILTDLLGSFMTGYGFSGNAANIQQDTSFAFDSAWWNELTTVRAIFDYVTGFYDKAWAVWDDKTLYWTSTAARPPDWVIPASTGVRMRLQPSIDQTASNIWIAYRDMQGRQRYQGPNRDANPNNIVNQKQLTRPGLVDMGVVSTGTVASAVSVLALNQMRFEIMRGDLEVPAMATLVSPTGQAIPAFKLKAGSVIRLPDAARSRDVFSTSYDRRTLFLVRQVDVDWDSQVVRVTMDNNTDKLSQYLARVQEIQAGRFVGIL